jgi:curved DNA-binding protein CbpA
MYRDLARKHHPDVGGRLQDMQEINAEYDELIKELPKRAADGKTYQPRDDQRETREQSDAFKAAVAAAIILEGVELEICGSWLWATGNTRVHKDALKAAGYQWSAKKAAWYWHDGEYHKKSAKKFTLDEIRGMWGSEKVEAEQDDRQPVAQLQFAF